MKFKGCIHTDKKCVDCGLVVSTKEIRFEEQSIFICDSCMKTLEMLIKMNRRNR